MRGWLIIYFSVFRIPSRIVRLLLNRAASMRCFFSVSDPPEPVRIFMSLYQRISEILPISSERAARLLRQSRPLFYVLPRRRRTVAIDNNSDFVTNSSQLDYLPIWISKSVPGFGAASISFLTFRARCAQNFSRRFTLLLVLFRAFGSVTR